MDTPDGASTADPTGGHAAETISKIQVLQGQLLLVEQLCKSFDESCRKYLQDYS